MLTNIIDFVLKLIPINYAKIILVSMLFLAGVFSSYKITSWYYSGEIEKLNSAVTQYEVAYTALAASTKKQNEEILKIKASQDEKSRKLEIAQKEARDASKRFYDEANTIQRKTLDDPTKACVEASNLINEQLIKERK